jgi:hypothetical protein
MTWRCPEPAVLRKAAEGATSLAATLRALEMPDNRSTRTALRRWLTEAGVPVDHFLGQAHGRGRTDQARRGPESVLVLGDGGRRTRSHLLRRALQDIGRPERCAECGTGPTWHGRPMTLEVDHVNGDWADNHPENLRLLCPNCHAITPTWCRGRRSSNTVRGGRVIVPAATGKGYDGSPCGGGAMATQQT